MLVTASLGFPIVRCSLALGVGVGVGVGVGDEKSPIWTLSRLMRLTPPETFLISKRIAFALLTVKVAVRSVVELVVTVAPT